MWSDEGCDGLRGSRVLMLMCWSCWLASGRVKAGGTKDEKVVVRCERRSRCMAGFCIPIPTEMVAKREFVELTQSTDLSSREKNDFKI